MKGGAHGDRLLPVRLLRHGLLLRRLLLIE
jgi:hypothetical protein